MLGEHLTRVWFAKGDPSAWLTRMWATIETCLVGVTCARADDRGQIWQSTSVWADVRDESGQLTCVWADVRNKLGQLTCVWIDVRDKIGQRTRV